MTDPRKRARILRLAATLKPEDLFTARFNAVAEEVFQSEGEGTDPRPTPCGACGSREIMPKTVTWRAPFSEEFTSLPVLFLECAGCGIDGPWLWAWLWP